MVDPATPPHSAVTAARTLLNDGARSRPIRRPLAGPFRAGRDHQWQRSPRRPPRPGARRAVVHLQLPGRQKNSRTWSAERPRQSPRAIGLLGLNEEHFSPVYRGREQTIWGTTALINPGKPTAQRSNFMFTDWRLWQNSKKAVAVSDNASSSARARAGDHARSRCYHHRRGACRPRGGA